MRKLKKKDSKDLFSSFADHPPFFFGLANWCKLSTSPKEKKSFVASSLRLVRTRVVNLKNRPDNPRFFSLILITVHH
jgi:hypothetical protein